MSVILEAQNLSLAFGGIKAVDEVSFTAKKGEITSIIGPNGAGKTTLFNLISGLYGADSGAVLLKGRNVTALPPERLAALGLSRTFQNLQVFFRMSAADNVMVGCHRHERMGVWPHLLGLPSVRRQNEQSRTAAQELLARVGLAGHSDILAGSMSYGALKRLEIARALAAGPEVLLLDEPAAGCNPVETEEIDALIHQLAQDGLGIVLIEHDMKMVMRISSHILVLAQGKRLAEGTAPEIRNNPVVIEAYLGVHGAKEAARA